ncbi:MAG: efflux RND transporter periplasmic adaptor subunit [Candidatus Thiodiazotropha lotti]|nr:efflux RND transporter periplasmic adaptor subunit [Candidatus Thiodiazotropha lotti]
MMRTIILTLFVIAAIATVAWQMLEASPDKVMQMLSSHDDDDHHKSSELHDEKSEEAYRDGPRGGKLFEQDGFGLELTLYETGIPPEFHVYLYRDGRPLSLDEVELKIELARLDGQVDHFEFAPQGDYLRGRGVVVEPHSFDVTIKAHYQGREYQWAFASYEGRSQFPDALAKEAGIVTEIAGPKTIAKVLQLSGRVQTVPNKLASVRARFPGVVQRVQRNLGDRVKAGDLLAHIQSNESLQSYSVKAPIDGVILARDVQIGMNTGETPLFLIADLSQVWIELDVFGKDQGKVQPAQAVRIATLNGDAIDGKVDWVSPLASHASQSVQARVVLDNSDGKLRPGQFVRGRVIVDEIPVELAVRQSAIQQFRDFRVVFAKIGDTYEVRMLELGRRNADWVEVTGGLKQGTEYVTGNSYLIKADIEKSGASHDH